MRVKLMKKIVFSLLLAFICPLVVNATNVDVPSADLSLDLPDSWYVFTRDNLDNNTDLDDLEIDDLEMLEYLEEYNLYLNAFNEDYDFFIYKMATEDVGSLPDYYDFELEEFATEIMNSYGADSYDIYDDNYKFVRIEYVESDYYIIDYYTIIDDQGYIISLQKLSEFNDDERLMMEDIVKSIHFDNYKAEDNKEMLVVAIGVGLVVVLGVVALVIAKVKDKNESKENV